MTAGPARLTSRRQPPVLIWGWIEPAGPGLAPLLQPWALDPRFRPGSLSLIYPLNPAPGAADVTVWCRGPVARQLAVYPFLDLFRLFRLSGLGPAQARALVTALRRGAAVFSISAVPAALGPLLRHRRLHPLAWKPAAR